jgi:hypothetical protein
MERINELYPALIAAIGALVILTNVVVEVLKKAIPNSKFPTNLLALIVSMVLTLVAFFAWAAVEQIRLAWYYVAAAIVVGLLVAYAAMFGFDKLKETLGVILVSKSGTGYQGKHENGPAD